MLSKPIYELVPYACISSGGVGVISIDNLLGISAGAVLYVLGSIIWTMRFHVRHPAKKSFKRKGYVLPEDLYEFKPFMLLAVAIILFSVGSSAWVFMASFLMCSYSLFIILRRIQCRF